MSEKQGFKLKKNQIIGASVAALLLIGGGSVYAVNSQKKAQAEKIELAEKKEKEDYKKLSLQVDESVKKAYDTRSAKDIEMAETIIKKLKEQDQKDPKAKMTKLHSFLDLIKKIDQLLATAEKSKKDSDIKAAQNSINEEKDEYLKKDKEAHQKRLDKLKKSIEEQKKKEAEKKKSAEDKVKQEEEQKREPSTIESNVAEVIPEKTNKEESNATQAVAEVNQEAGVESAQEINNQTSSNNQVTGSVTPDYGNTNTGGGENTVQTTPSPEPIPTPSPTPTPEPTPDPTPSQKWIGWWNDGTQLHQTGGNYNTQAEALAAAEALYDANGMVGTYGASQL